MVGRGLCGRGRISLCSPRNSPGDTLGCRDEWWDADFATGAEHLFIFSPRKPSGDTLGCRDEWWDADFAAGVHFTGDLLVAAPDVIESALQEDDEFVVLATDGLWCARARGW